MASEACHLNSNRFYDIIATSVWALLQAQLQAGKPMRTAWYRNAPRGSRLSKPEAATAGRMSSGHVSGGSMNVPLQVRQSLIMVKYFVLSIASGCSDCVDRCIVNMRHFAVGQHANRLQTSKLTVYHFTALFRSAPSILAERTQRSHALSLNFTIHTCQQLHHSAQTCKQCLYCTMAHDCCCRLTCMALLTLLARSLVCCRSQGRSTMATLARKRAVQR